MIKKFNPEHKEYFIYLDPHSDEEEDRIFIFGDSIEELKIIRSEIPYGKYFCIAGIYKVSEVELYECTICGHISLVGEYDDKYGHSKGICFGCNAWLELYEHDQQEETVQVIIHGNHYLAEPEKEPGFKGFGGRPFNIKFHDGRKIISRNLWHQGKIPLRFKKLFPDNAECEQLI